jgi:hypothetical protein
MARRKRGSSSSRQSSTKGDARPALSSGVTGPEQDDLQLVGFGTRLALWATPEQVKVLLDIHAMNMRLAAAGLDAMSALQRKATRPPSEERFKQGLLLLAWIDHYGNGKLTKELVNEIKENCKDWPCVRDYQKHKSRERLRNALRNLAEDIRGALRDGRLPAGWGRRV